MAVYKRPRENSNIRGVRSADGANPCCERRWVGCDPVRWFGDPVLGGAYSHGAEARTQV